MRAGTTLAGRYRIERELGAGGMGVVYKAHDTRLGRDVAVKLLARDLTADAEAVHRFEREARAASSLNHPNIITVFDAGVDGDVAFIVTELLHGSTLHDRIAGKPLAPATVLDFAIRIAAGLSAAHAAGIVHRDIKPRNIFLTRDGGLKVLDFGVARLLRADGSRGGSGAASATIDGAMVGTPAYMAPEQLRGETVDARTDIFAFGCVLHEMLAGQGPFDRPTLPDLMAAILVDPPDALAAGVAVPPILDRVRLRCLEKDSAERFQSATDLRFTLESLLAGSPAFTAPGSGHAPGDRRFRVAAFTALPVVGLAAWLLAKGSVGTADLGPVVEHAAVVVPVSARPIAPAVAPSGDWVAYIALAGTPGLYVKFVNGGAAVDVARDANLPLQTRTVVGGIDILPDGSGITVAGRPKPASLFEIPGIWIVPAPLGGPPRRLTERYATVRWSPDGTMFSGVLANPVLGDAVVVAAADGQGERVLVPASGGVHLHQVAWGHDGRHVYYSRTLEPSHTLSEIHRVTVDGGEKELVVPSQGIAMYPTPTPDGRGLIYAGDRVGEGLNLWWHPFDGSPDRRITTGPGEFTEPYLSRDGRSLVMLARRPRGGVVRVDAGARRAATITPVTEEDGGDRDPSVAGTSGRIYLTSLRGGRRQIWSVDSKGQGAMPITSGANVAQRPAVSPDGRQVAFVSVRDGRRGIWLAAADGGTPRLLIEAEVVDYPSWAPDGRRIVYAAAGTSQAELWIIDVNGGAPTRLPSDNGRAPTWSPVSDEIAFVELVEGKPNVLFVDPKGARVRAPLPIVGVSLPTAIAWSPDGTRLGLVTLPGRAAAEAWVLETRTGVLRRVVELPAPAAFEGVTWTADGQSLLLGLVEYDTEVLLLRLR